MQEIVNYCATMCEATGGKVQKKKVMMCIWKWKNNNMLEVPMSAKLNEEKIKTIEVKNSVKIL